MRIYVEKHKKKFQLIDQQMKEKIFGVSSCQTDKPQKKLIKIMAQRDS